MRIAHLHIGAFVTVLFLAAIFVPAIALDFNNSSMNNHSQHRERREIYDPLTSPWMYSKQQLHNYLWEKSSEFGEPGSPMSCCPSVLEVIEPAGGINRQGIYVKLYQDGDVKQRFYEISCERGIEGQPCRFLDRKLHNMSRCVQKFSYSYALMREQTYFSGSGSGSGAGIDNILSGILPNTRHHHGYRGGSHVSLPSASDPTIRSGWMLDYIRVRSGCSCEITPKPIKKKRFYNNYFGNNTNKVKKSSNKKFYSSNTIEESTNIPLT